MRFHPRCDLLNQLGDVTGNYFMLFRRLIRESVCSVIRRLCAFFQFLEYGEPGFDPFIFLHSLRLCCYGINSQNWRWRKKVQQTVDGWWWLIIFAMTLLIIVVQRARFLMFSHPMFAYFYVHGWFWHGWRSWWWRKRELRFPLNTFNLVVFFLHLCASKCSDGAYESRRRKGATCKGVHERRRLCPLFDATYEHVV